MSTADIVWGVALLAAGIFVCVYGTLLFRFALAVMGFGVGFIAAMKIFEGQDETARILIAFALGGIGAILLFTLVKFTFYIAGGICGLVIGLVVVGIIDIFGSRPDGIVQTILTAAGAGIGAFFGSRLGNIIVLLGSTLAGSFLIMSGISVLFASRINAEATEPGMILAQKLSLVIFLVICAVSGLGQWNAQRFRQRVLS